MRGSIGLSYLKPMDSCLTYLALCFGCPGLCQFWLEERHRMVLQGQYAFYSRFINGLDEAFVTVEQ